MPRASLPAAAVTTLAALALAAPASAARFDPAPPVTGNTSGQGVTFTLRTDGHTQSSGVAYKLSTEPDWHRCQADGATVTLQLPAGDYRLDIADDTSRPWFDANAPGSTTPECDETTAPKNAPLSYAYFFVRDAPRAPTRSAPPLPLDACGDELDHVAALHARQEYAADRYAHRRTRARRTAARKARAVYLRARRRYLAHC